MGQWVSKNISFWIISSRVLLKIDSTKCIHCALCRAYTETSIWQNLNDYAGIGKGAGETVWASAPPVLTVRHMQHYGDMKLAMISFDHHVKWLQFLIQHFDEGMRVKNYDDELKHYTGRFSGLGDWLAMRIRDTFLTHTAFAMASGRCVAYIARKLGDKKEELKGIRVATKYKKKISYLYLKNGKDNFDFPLGSARHTPGCVLCCNMMCSILFCGFILLLNISINCVTESYSRSWLSDTVHDYVWHLCIIYYYHHFVLFLSYYRLHHAPDLTLSLLLFQ